MFVKKFTNLDFLDLEVVDRHPMEFDALAAYPLFDQDFLKLLKEWLPPERLREVVFSLVIRGRKPEARQATAQ